MGYSISQETHERIERYRAEGRLCQGSSRCSQRGTRIAVALLSSVTDEADNETWYWSTFVVCAKHAKQMEEWPAFVNGATLWTRALNRTEQATAVVDGLIEALGTPTPENIAEAEHRMRVDESKRAALWLSKVDGGS
jgi:hypothetical protein